MTDNTILKAEEAVQPVQDAVREGLPVKVEGVYVDGVDLRYGWVTFTPVSEDVPPTPYYPYDIIAIEVGW